MSRRGNVKVLYSHRLNEVKKTNANIGDRCGKFGKSPSPKTNKDTGKVFIDCSVEGDLMAHAGVSYTVGREDNSVYGETYNGVQMMQAINLVSR